MPITTTVDKSVVLIDKDLARLRRKLKTDPPAYRWMTREKIDRRLDQRVRLTGVTECT